MVGIERGTVDLKEQKEEWRQEYDNEVLAPSGRRPKSSYHRAKDVVLKVFLRIVVYGGIY
jgi:hypothetical protein